MNGVFLLSLSVVLIWAYYSMNAYQINLQYLFGYAFGERHLELILFVFSTHTIAAILMIYLDGFNFLLIGFVVCLFVVDMLVISLLGHALTRYQISNIIKGSE